MTAEPPPTTKTQMLSIANDSYVPLVRPLLLPVLVPAPAAKDELDVAGVLPVVDVPVPA